jgi:hypothetical protein
MFYLTCTAQECDQVFFSAIIENAMAEMGHHMHDYGHYTFFVEEHRDLEELEMA